MAVELLHMDITPDKKNLVELISSARIGRIVLPRFQRSFVWEYNDVVDFLISIFKGFFIGSFLYLDCDSENVPFDYRPIEGVDLRKEEMRPENMILDGQQRITTLHYVLYAPEKVNLKFTKYPYQFFLDLQKAENGDIDEAIYGLREQKSKRLIEKETQFKEKILPFIILKNFQTWDTWLDEYQDWLRASDKDQYDVFVEKQRPIWKKLINQFFNTMVPIIEIPKVSSTDEKGIAEVCAIFEKMNSTGVQLSVFDLLTARLYKYGIDLRKLWEDTVDNYDLIEDFSERDANPYGVFILRFMALIRGIDVKSKNIINFSPENFEKDWQTGSQYFQKALERLESTNLDGFGVFERKWMSYPPMVVTLAALLYQIESLKLDSIAYKAVKKWYWGSILSERYQSAVESTTTRDYKELSTYIKDNNEYPSIFKEIDDRLVNNPNLSFISTNRISSVYKGVMNLLALEGAKDFRLQDSIEFHDLDDHHIFPQAYLKEIKDSTGKQIYKDELINSVVNKTLISASTNRQIGKKSPKEYLSNLIDGEESKKLLYKHFIGTEALEDMLSNNFEDFLKNRDLAIVTKVKKLLSNET